MNITWYRFGRLQWGAVISSIVACSVCCQEGSLPEASDGQFQPNPMAAQPQTMIPMQQYAQPQPGYVQQPQPVYVQQPQPAVGQQPDGQQEVVVGKVA